MAALLKLPAKGGKTGGRGKGLHGRMPTKRSINLVLVDENKISIPKAILGIVLIVALAGVFSKFLVYDRLMAVSEASAKVDRLQTSLDEAMEKVKSFGDVESTYAHYTMEGMSQAELDLVDRVQVLDLVASILPERQVGGESDDEDDEFLDGGDDFFDDEDGEGTEDDGEDGHAIRGWSAAENVLSIEIAGSSLEALNLVARSLEESPIVNSCTITTANKDTGQRIGGEVLAKLVVYLQKPVEEVAAQ